jgi:hypothetical protein
MARRDDCKCIDEALPLLTVRNTRLVVMLSLTGECDKAVLKTEQIRVTRGGKPAVVVATYCPFCGKKYPVRKRPS